MLGGGSVGSSFRPYWVRRRRASRCRLRRRQPRGLRNAERRTQLEAEHLSEGDLGLRREGNRPRRLLFRPLASRKRRSLGAADLGASGGRLRAGPDGSQPGLRLGVAAGRLEEHVLRAALGLGRRRPEVEVARAGPSARPPELPSLIVHMLQTISVGRPDTQSAAPLKACGDRRGRRSSALRTSLPLKSTTRRLGS